METRRGRVKWYENGKGGKGLKNGMGRLGEVRILDLAGLETGYGADAAIAGWQLSGSGTRQV